MHTAQQDSVQLTVPWLSSSSSSSPSLSTFSFRFSFKYSTNSWQWPGSDKQKDFSLRTIMNGSRSVNVGRDTPTP